VTLFLVYDQSWLLPVAVILHIFYVIIIVIIRLHRILPKFAAFVTRLKYAAARAVYAARAVCAGSFGAAFAKCLWPLVFHVRKRN